MELVRRAVHGAFEWGDGARLCEDAGKRWMAMKWKMQMDVYKRGQHPSLFSIIHHSSSHPSRTSHSIPIHTTSFYSLLLLSSPR